MVKCLCLYQKQNVEKEIKNLLLSLYIMDKMQMNLGIWVYEVKFA